MLSPRDKKPHADTSLQNVIPLYYKIYETIRVQIMRGDYPVDTPLPGEHELASRFNVSRVTIRRTMSILENAGMITRLRGRGTFVNPEAIARATLTNFSGYDQNVREFEATTQVTIINSGVTEMPPWGLEAINEVGNTWPVLGLEYTRSTDGVPFSYVRAFIPMTIAKNLDIEKLGNKTITTAIEESGTIVVDIDQKLTAVSAGDVESERLHLAIGQPLIRVRRVMYDGNRFPVQCLEVLYDPAYYEYHLTLSREKTTGEAPRWVPTNR